MPHISTLSRGTAVQYWSPDRLDEEPLHAIIAHVDHANTEDNNHPRLNLAILLPNGQWTRRFAVPHEGLDGEAGKAGKWREVY